MPYPNLIIIGAMKSGTTSLHEYLSYHPEISMSQRKEINYFVAHQNWSRGLEWYQSHFPEATKVRGESSPNNTRFPLFSGVAERMHDLLPHAKLIYCVRDPIKRFISHYLHSHSLGKENRSLAEVVISPELPRSPYLLCSLYHYQLEQYLAHYPASQIKLVILEALKACPQETLREAFTFLGVDPEFQDARFFQASLTMPPGEQRRRSPLKSWLVRRNLRGVYWTERNLPWLFGPPLKTPELTPELRARLHRALAEDTDRLARFSGYDFVRWNWSTAGSKPPAVAPG